MHLIDTLLSTLSQYHEDYPRFAHRYAGNRCQIQCGKLSFTVQIHHSGIQCSHLPTDNKIHIHSNQILALFGLGDTKVQVEFSGDIGFCQHLAKLLNTQSLDLEGFYHDHLPPGLAVILTETGEGFKHLISHQKNQMRQYLKDYLTHETGILVDQASSNALYEKTLQLKWSLDQLSQKHCNPE